MERHQGRVYIVLGDAGLRQEALQALPVEEGLVVEALSDWEDALELVERTSPDLLITSLEPVDKEACKAVSRFRELAPQAVLVVILESINTAASVSEAIQKGADHCLTRPIHPEAISMLLERALKRAVAFRKGEESVENVVEQYHLGHFNRVVGSHPSMQLLLHRTLQAAKTKATVLICGETGTGKGLIASGIHEHSKRNAGPFVKLNCAALSESLLESELFGHEKGAFTGAMARRKGKFELAHGGTLFIDEVSEIPLSTQVKLLRFLQEKDFERVGGNETIRVDVRIIAASNRDLSLLVTEKKFREDLYYRLNVVRLDVPPLRARPSDIPLLAEHFLRYYAREHERESMGFTPRTMEALMAHPWPGNVRGLQNAVEQAVVMCDNNLIDVDDLPFSTPHQEISLLKLMIPGVTLAELERYAILKTLEAVGGSPSKAASILGISRRTIQYRLKEWGLSKMGKEIYNSNDDQEVHEEEED